MLRIYGVGFLVRTLSLSGYGLGFRMLRRVLRA